MATRWQSIDWATTWSGATSILTLGLLVATGVYAWLTLRMVRASEAQIRETTRPRVLVFVAPRESSFLTLSIENIGLMAAQNVELRLDKPVHPFLGRLETDLREALLFSSVLPTLPPRTLLRFALGVGYLGENLDRTKHPLEFTVLANYEGAGQKYSEQFTINVATQFSRVLIEHDHLADFGKTFPDQFEKLGRELLKEMRNSAKDK